MANTRPIVHKRTFVSGRLPEIANTANTRYIYPGELSINLTDQKVHTSNGSVIFEVGSNLSTLSVQSIVANGSVGANGFRLTSNGTAVYWSDDRGFTGSTGFTGSRGTVSPSDTAPDSPFPGQIWYDSTTGKSYFWYVDGTSSQWVLFADPTVTDGIDGYTGSRGLIGFTGSQGVQGTTGFTGSQGALGFTGSVGPQGSQGTTGFTGSQGAQGIIGFTGSQGAQGVIGFTGSQGAQGTTGFTGSQGAQGNIGFTGSTGFTGSASTVAGPTGFTGSKGADGNFGGATFDYTFDTTTTSSDPGTGLLRFNNANIASATAMFIDASNDTSTDITSFLNTIDDSTSTIKGHFRVSNRLDSSDFALFTISSITNNTGWFTVNCAYVSGSATSFTNLEDIIITFARTGDRGDTGFTGSQGATGFTGSQGAQGTTGFTGSQGAQGTTGFTGSQGAQGVIGFTGSQGAQGTTGFTGSQGAQGTTGFIGSQGAQGVIGFTGSQGAIGFTGSQGSAGFTGSQGTAGFTGSTGFTGSRGALQAWSLKTSNYTAVDGDRIIVDTSGGTFTVTLPATPSSGFYVQITDGGTLASTPLTVARNGSTIEGLTEDVSLDITGLTYEFIYGSSTWHVTATTGARGYTGSAGTGGGGSAGLQDIFMLMGI